jgi:hypothetical protein
VNLAAPAAAARIFLFVVARGGARAALLFLWAVAALVETRDDRFRPREDRFQSSPDLEQSSHDREKSSPDLWKSSHVLDQAAAVLLLFPHDRSDFAAVVERSFPVRFRMASDGFQWPDDLRELSA